MTPTTLRIGTRGSVLATTQAGHVRDDLSAGGHPAVLEIVATAGDVNMAPVERIGVGVFTAALREALVAGRVDVAVHSFKDMPTAPDERLVLAATPRRVDPRDALIARDGLTLDELPDGARIGTGAPRRIAQLRAYAAATGRTFDIRPLRGNIESRMNRVASGELDAVLLACAGLRRAGMFERATEAIDPAIIMPSPAQGVLGVECRAGDDATIAACARLDDPSTRAIVTAERTLLAVLEAGCTAPVGALATPVDGEQATGGGPLIELRAVAAAHDGSALLRGSRRGPAADAAELGRALAVELIDRGAPALMARTTGADSAPPTSRAEKSDEA